MKSGGWSFAVCCALRFTNQNCARSLSPWLTRDVDPLVGRYCHSHDLPAVTELVVFMNIKRRCSSEENDLV